MIAIDTNILVRHLAQDHPAQSAAASAFLGTELSATSPGFVSSVVLCELCWVMTGSYGLARSALTTLLDSLIAVDALRFEHRAAIARAVEAHRAGVVEFSDCLLREIGRDAGCTEVATFDRKFAKLEDVRLLG